MWFGPPKINPDQGYHVLRNPFSTMAALAPASTNVKSQASVALERRLKRLRTNPDHLLLCHAKDKRVAELEEENKTIDTLKKLAT
jgi:hypothetical protein